MGRGLTNKGARSAPLYFPILLMSPGPAEAGHFLEKIFVRPTGATSAGTLLGQGPTTHDAPRHGMTHRSTQACCDAARHT